MPTLKLTNEALIISVREVEKAGGNVSRAARALGIGRCTLIHRMKQAVERELVDVKAIGKAKDFEFPAELPDGEQPIEQLLEARRDTWRRKQRRAKAAELIPIKITLPGPIGIAHFGDLHLDDDGTNFALLEQHTKLIVETEGMFAGCVGDLQNSWIGRLAYLYADQSTTAREAWALIEWWIGWIAPKLIYLIEGNHDSWAHGVNRVSPLSWILARGQQDSLHMHGARFELRLPAGKSITLNARHDFQGSSQWNPAHGVSKAAQLGMHDDILCAGHRHISGYAPVKDPRTGLISHAIRIASYKQIDDYVQKNNFPDQNIFECPITIIDPDEPDPRYRVSVFFNPVLGAKVLTVLRREWEEKYGKKVG